MIDGALIHDHLPAVEEFERTRVRPLAEDLIVVTNNVEELGRVPELRIVNWAEE